MSTQPCGCDYEAGWTCNTHLKANNPIAGVHPTTVFAPIPGVTVIGLGHKARHGKDTVAQALLEAYPDKVLRVGFADALYDYCRVEHGMTVKDAPLLQRVGVQMRDRDPLVWVKAVYWKLMDKKPAVAVIPDVRFENEAAFVKLLGGTTIRVVRYNADGSVFQAADRDPKHVSECQLDDYKWDLTILNNKGLDGLHIAARAAYKYFTE